MLVIRRTDSGGLRLSDGRRADTAATEEQARRLVTTWGYGNFSFNKALIQMKEAEGSIAPVANPWTARSRSEQPAAPATQATPPAPSKTETPESDALKEPPTMNVPARTRRPRAAQAPTPGETDPVAAAPVVAPEPTVAETAARPRRVRKARTADVEAPAPTAEASPESAAAVPAEVPEAKPAKASRPRRARKSGEAAAESPAVAGEAAVAPVAEAHTVGPDAEEATPAKRTRGRGARKATATRAEPEATPPVAEVAPAPEVTKPASGEEAAAPAARKRGRRAKSEAGDGEAQPAAESAAAPVETVSEADATSQPAPQPKLPRAPRRRTAGDAPVQAVSVRSTGARTPEEWLEAARALFAEGTQALREIEGATLPFARGPWTELREKSAEILACLQGERPVRG